MADSSGRTIVEVEIVPELCMRFLNCARITRGAFAIDRATGKSYPRRWQQVDSKTLWKAGWSCPSGAIRFTTTEGYVVPRWEEAARWDSSRHAAAAIIRDG